MYWNMESVKQLTICAPADFLFFGTTNSFLEKYMPTHVRNSAHMPMVLASPNSLRSRYAWINIV